MHYNKGTLISFGVLLIFLINFFPIQKSTLLAQKKNSTSKQFINFNQFSGLKYRFVGPMIGGRVNAVVGHPTKKLLPMPDIQAVVSG